MAAFEDTFTEISDTAIESHTPDVGTGWTLQSGTSGDVQVDGPTDAAGQQGSGGVATCDDQGANHITYFDMIQNANGLYSNWFSCARLVDSNNFVGVEQDLSNSSRLVKLVSGSKTTLVDITHAANDAYEIHADGSTIKVYLNTVQQGSDQTVTDVSTSETSQGLAFQGTARTNGLVGYFNADPIAGATNLVIADAALAMTADNVALTQDHQLAVNDAALAMVSDNVTLTTAGDLVIADAALAMTADNVSLTQDHQLVIQDADLAMTADNLDLVSGLSLAINGANMALSADNLALTQTHVLVIQDADLGLSADNVVLTQDHVLVIQDALLAMTADGATLGAIEVTAPAWRVLVIPEDDRLLAILTDNRTLTVEGE